MSTIKAKAAPALPITPAAADWLYGRLSEQGHAVIRYVVDQRTESAFDDQDETVRIRIEGIEFDDDAAAGLYQQLRDTRLNTGTLFDGVTIRVVDQATGEISETEGAEQPT